MNVSELVDASVAAALLHAMTLQKQLRKVHAEDPELEECGAQLHRLIGDIASVRNAAELLRRDSQTV